IVNPGYPNSDTEPEIPPVEIDTTIDTETPEVDVSDIDPPPIEVEPPEVDVNDQDTEQDQDTRDNDTPPANLSTTRSI
ncbi:26642_t:CDS:2, partial [Gigaspora margarita]